MTNKTNTAQASDGVTAGDTYLSGLRVIEVADELGEYCGKLLGGLGADVVKIEPPQGEATRHIGPFYRDIPDPDRSLHFWHFNLGKRSAVLDLDTARDQATFRDLAGNADIVIDTRPRGFMDARGIGYDALRAINPRLIYVRITPFGDDGPWADFQSSDLIHLALGGMMMNCGYDPDPLGRYDTPPVAPQMWQSFQIAGEMAVISVLGALNYRLKTGLGQKLVSNVHDAVSKNTEQDLPGWIFLRMPHRRLTCRHALPVTMPISDPLLAITKDGRYLLPYQTYLKGFTKGWDAPLDILRKYGMQDDLDDPKYLDEDVRALPRTKVHVADLIRKLSGRLLFKDELWREGQNQGLTWGPIRKPEENIGEEHWTVRGSFAQVHHPELDESFTYIGPKWKCDEVGWAIGSRAPLLGEHTDAVMRDWSSARAPHQIVYAGARLKEDPMISARGKPFALSDVKVVDLSWMLASAGAGRYLTAMGAELIKVEHMSKLDGMRWGRGPCPPGGRAARDAATAPLDIPESTNPNRSGIFMEINAGKLGLSLNLKNPKGRKILEDLIRDADMVIEGYSPGTMDRMGLGYDRLKELNPGIIYVQQSAFGQAGTYGDARGFGPTAQAMSGLSEMSGLPEPYPPAGIGYSYLDWFGAYNMANAMLAALYRRNITGKGCYIDASQAETGMYLTGSAVLDYSVNGRHWSRYGNRSPHKPAAPHGAYRVKGEDRWIAIGAFDQDQWQALAQELGHPEWMTDPRFATLAERLTHQDELDALVQQATQDRDGFALMNALQAAHVPAGMCQTAEDRYEHDPQLKHLNWLVELDQAEIGRWPVKEHPVTMSETPPYMGGRFNRSGPNLGQDSEYVLKTHLGYDADQVKELVAEGVI